jgi:flagellin
MLTRAKELTIQFSGTSDGDAQKAINAELTQIFTEVQNIETNTEYNGDKMFDGGGSFSIYTDINGTTSSLGITGIDIVDTAASTTAATIGVNGGNLTVGDGTGARAYTHANFAAQLKTAVDSAINGVATQRGEIGSYQNRFEASIRNFEGTAENLQAAESRIRDVDMAKEMVGFTKDTIIQQAAQAMLVQANQLPQNIVGLLR